MQSLKVSTSRDYQEYLIEALQNPKRAAGYIAAILEEEDPEPELLASALDDVAQALNKDSDRQWVKDFGASGKSQAIHELAEWLNGLGLRLTVEEKYSEQFLADIREAQQEIENGDVVSFESIRRNV